MKFIPEDLRPYFKISVGFHVGIFIIFGVKVLLFPDLSNLDSQATLKVDLVALPNKDDNKKVPAKLAPKPEETKPVVKELPKETPKIEEQPKAETKTAKKEEVKKDETKKASESDAFAKLREMEALKNLEKNKETAKATEEVEFDAPVKGNRLAPGDSLTGLNKIQYNNYKKVLQDAVKSKWDLPPWLQDGELSAEALIKIDQSGTVTEQSLIKSSGNSIYDKYVLDTINKSSPFPPPPDKFVNVVAIRGVVITFN